MSRRREKWDLAAIRAITVATCSLACEPDERYRVVARAEVAALPASGGMSAESGAREEGLPERALLGGDAGVVLGPEQCPGCFLEGECVAARAVSPTNPCEVCAPEVSRASWTAAAGTPCDDGLFCTTNDACTASGQCSGDARECEDGVTCDGISVCVEALRACSSPSNECGENAICDIATGSCVSTCAGCLVEGVCVAAGGEQPGNSCLACDPAVSTVAFTVAVGKPCGEGATECSGQDTCDALGACADNDLPPTTACGDAAASACDQPDLCDGNGACSRRLRPNGFPCADGAFCTVGDSCQAGQCVAGGPRACAGECVEDADRCLATDGSACAIDSDCLGGTCSDWFQDLDGDGFGGDAVILRTCGFMPPPGGGFTAQVGDCCDLGGEAQPTAILIHPGQTQVFTVAQTVCPGVLPLDYDCDGEQ